jgi:predicted site-specific integrase-resolvase
MKTTGDAARIAGISRASLQAWLRDGKVKGPKVVLRGGKAVRLWSEIDIARLKALKARIYRKGRGRKPDAKK